MRKKLTAADAVFALLLLAAAALCWAKCRYGFAFYDESFYVTTARRLVQGDAPVAQEWNLAQFFAVFTAPFAALYESVTGGTDGILLAFRRLFVLVQTAAALFLYARLREAGRLGAGAAALAFALFAPYNVPALSYNSLAVLFLALAGVLAATMRTHLRAQTAAAGVLFAAAVLCQPFLALGWFVLAALWLARGRLGRAGVPTAFFAPFTAGVAALAALWLGFVFTRTGPILFLKGLRTMLQSTDRSSESFGQGLWQCTTAAPFLFVGFAVLAVLLALDKRRRLHRAGYLLGACALALGFQASFWADGPYINFFMFAVVLCAPFAACTGGADCDRRLLACVWAPGVLYAAVSAIASNQKFYAVSSACTVAAVAGLVLTARAAQDAWRQGTALGRAAALCAGLVLAVQLGAEGWTRQNTVFWDDPDNMTVLLTEGPERGLYTTADQAQIYTDLLADTAPLRELDAGQTAAVLSRHASWLYLTTDARVGTFSSWLQLNDGIREVTKDHLTVFYDRYPDRLPDLAFVESKYPDVKELYCTRYGYTAEQVGTGWLLRRG